MFPFVIRHDRRPEMVALRATIVLQAALIRILLRLLPDALRHLTEADRRQLFELGKPPGWKAAAEVLGCIAAANTLRGWYRQLVTHTPSSASFDRSKANVCTTSVSSVIGVYVMPSTSIATSTITDDRIRASVIASSILIRASPTLVIALNGIKNWADY